MGQCVRNKILAMAEGAMTPLNRNRHRHPFHLFALSVALLCLLASGGHAMEAANTLAEAEEALNVGIEAAEGYRFEEAIANFSRATDSNRLSDERLAEAHLRHARAHEAVIYYTAFGPEEQADRRLIRMLQDSSRARALGPGIAEFSVTEGDAFALLGAYDEAERAYEDAIALDLPIPIRLWIRLGVLHRIRGDYDTALSYFDLTLQRWTDNWGMPPHYHKGRKLYKAGRYREAVDSLSRGIMHQPDYIWALYYRACAHDKLGNYSEALADYDSAINIMDDDPAELTQFPVVQRINTRVPAERQAVADLSNGSEGAFALTELCTEDGFSEQLRSRSTLLTDDILAAIDASDDVARNAAAAFLSGNIDPQLAAMCALVPCRETIRANPIEIADGETFLEPIRGFPYVDPDGVILIYPEEAITVSLPIEDDIAGLPRLRAVNDRDGSVPLDLPDEPTGPMATVRFELTWSDLGYILEVQSTVDATIKYDAYMSIVVGAEIRTGPTSSCAVSPRISVIEDWRDPIVMLMIDNIRVLPAGDETMTCS